MFACDGVYAYARVLEDECWIVALNVNQHAVKLHIPIVDLPQFHGEFREVLSGQRVHIEEQELTYDVPARSGVLLVMSDVRSSKQ